MGKASGRCSPSPERGHHPSQRWPPKGPKSKPSGAERLSSCVQKKRAAAGKARRTAGSDSRNAAPSARHIPGLILILISQQPCEGNTDTPHIRDGDVRGSGLPDALLREVQVKLRSEFRLCILICSSIAHPEATPVQDPHAAQCTTAAHASGW